MLDEDKARLIELENRIAELNEAMWVLNNTVAETENMLSRIVAVVDELQAKC